MAVALAGTIGGALDWAPADPGISLASYAATRGPSSQCHGTTPRPSTRGQKETGNGVAHHKTGRRIFAGRLDRSFLGAALGSQQWAALFLPGRRERQPVPL
jgi:hypothetical protein